MAAGRISAPGTETGPCLDPCGHLDCAMTRAEAAALCTRCETPIGYETRFYAARVARADGGRDLSHATCEERLALDAQSGPMP